MNWAGDFAQEHIDPSDSVLDLGCGIMQATMNFFTNYPKTKLKCDKLLGVDIYEPYLDFLKEKGIQTLKHDLTDLPLPIPDKSYDVVLLMDILEHLSLIETAALEKEASRIARKKIIVISPSIFRSNIEHTMDVYGLGSNPLQKHRCFISREFLKEKGYDVKNVKKRNMFYHLGVKRLQLRVLHVWDQAGVAALMAVYQRKLGHEADVIKLEEFDGLGIVDFYGFQLIPAKTPAGKGLHRKVYNKFDSSIFKAFIRGLKKRTRGFRRRWRSLSFYFKVASMAKDYDILHVHSSWQTVFFTPFKKRILEFHGDDSRIKPSMYPWFKKVVFRAFIKIYTLFYQVYVSTPDLLRDVSNSEWLPNPVDPEHFKRKGKCEAKSALYVHNWYESGDHAKEIANHLGLNLKILDRTAAEWVPHSEFPAFLSKFEFFIERKEIPSLSKTGLEALAMGLKLIQGWNNKIVQGLDPEHLPENVAARTVQIYRERLS